MENTLERKRLDLLYDLLEKLKKEEHESDTVAALSWAIFKLEYLML